MCAVLLLLFLFPHLGAQWRTSGRRVKYIAFCSPLLRRLADGAFERFRRMHRE